MLISEIACYGNYRYYYYYYHYYYCCCCCCCCYYYYYLWIVFIDFVG